ncbi:MAG: shikimate dehydrogenase [Phaeodactylibacter sp.]|nr:shikimate dehydrogenase [Phaeodactylibacter sp.]MCB9053237.1 shikimate dehydrogenase [Lewinellaceae bacterium]
MHPPTHLFGLIGYPLSHSFSKRYFNEKFRRENRAGHHYELFPLEDIGELPGLISNHPNLRGLNVTIPYKQQVRAYLDGLDETAAAVGAVNTIKIDAGKCTGYNTDVFGFELSLRRFLEGNGTTAEGLRALVLGTGGAARAVVYALRKMGIAFHLVSRSQRPEQLTYRELNETLMQNHRLIVNTTPLGMSPEVDTYPEIPFQHIGPQHLLYDLVYNPEETAFMARGKQRGAAVFNGLEMLHLQAEKAWEIWNS